MAKRNITTKVIAKNPSKKLPVGGGCTNSGAITDSNFNLLKMTAKQALAFKVKQFKSDKALVNFNAEIAVLLSSTGDYWAVSVAVTTLTK